MNNTFYKLNRYGEIVNINLVRDKKTGKSKGFCFLCYEDQRSTVLAVDNFNGIKVTAYYAGFDWIFPVYGLGGILFFFCLLFTGVGIVLVSWMYCGGCRGA